MCVGKPKEAIDPTEVTKPKEVAKPTEVINQVESKEERKKRFQHMKTEEQTLKRSMEFLANMFQNSQVSRQKVFVEEQYNNAYRNWRSHRQNMRNQFPGFRLLDDLDNLLTSGGFLNRCCSAPK